MSKPNPAVDRILANTHLWRDELLLLRRIVLKTTLSEEVKWDQACYTHHGANVAILFAFKAYCGPGFFKGALMPDPYHLLKAQTKNVQAARLLRFTSLADIHDSEEIILEYLQHAIDVEESGAKLQRRPTSDYPVVPELVDRFLADPAFKAAFDALTPGRQRGYLLFFAQAKQSKTRQARIDKFTAAIFAGKGYQD